MWPAGEEGRMQPVSYRKLYDPAAASAADAAEPCAAFIAVGTELVNWMKDGIRTPSLLVDINALPLRQIEVRADGLRIGALARMSDVAPEPAIRRGYPVL